MGNSQDRRRESRERMRLFQGWITSFGEGADRKAKAYFLATFALALLLAGLPMIGLTVNLWIGAPVMAFAFTCGATALWLWEGFSRFHLILRWITVIIVGTGYCVVVGRQIWTQYELDHPLLVLDIPKWPTPHMPWYVTGVVPTHSTTNAAPIYKLHLAFKDSPTLNATNKTAISKELNAFYDYLTALGFQMTTDVPPIGIVPGRGGTTGGMFAKPINSRLVGLWAGSDDPAGSAREAYSRYVFTLLVRIFDYYPQEYDNRFNAMNVFSEYFSSSFTDKRPINPDWSKDWIAALWEVRAKYGKLFVDRSMKEAVVLIDDPNFARDVSPNLFFYLRFRYGEQAVTDDHQKLGGVDEIFEKYHLYERPE